jgi:RNA polymerase sigma-70 factor (ECF subfamily)
VMIDTQSLRGIWSAVGRLSERQKAVFMLRFIEEMQLEEIAEVMDLKLGSVKSHLHRAIEAVRRSCAPKAG